MTISRTTTKMDPETFQLLADRGGEESEQVRPEPLPFEHVNQYTTFRAEFAVHDGHFTFHFFRTLENYGNAYWQGVFPGVLDTHAQQFFRSPHTEGRLFAEYMPDYNLDSWFLRALGFANSLDPAALARAFLASLDAALDATGNTSSSIR